MKFLLGVLVAAVLAVIPISVHAVSGQGVNNFRITSFDSSYDLSKDTSSRSVLKTTETITAQFPSFNQNHGLERALPTSYDTHSTGLVIDSVTGSDGGALEYSVIQQGDMNILRIGNASTYVHGEQVYKIAYTQHDVTRFFADTGRDEWYWDTNGTQWQVPIDALSITATISPELLSARVGEPACYRGISGGTGKCTLTPVGEGGFTLMASGLTAGENVTVAFGFNEGAFAKYQPTLFEQLFGIWIITTIFTTIAGVITLISLSVAYYRRRNRDGELHTLVAEYIPPKDTSVLISAQVISAARSIFSAQLIDFAVRHFIEIIERSPKTLWKAAEYDIKIITDPSTLHNEEFEMLEDMFGTSPKVGQRLQLSTLRTNSIYQMRTVDNDKKIKDLIEGKYMIRAKSVATSRYFYRWTVGILIVGVLTLSPSLLIFAGIVALLGYYIRPLTDKGFELRRYVLGLDKYIKAAEVERLKFLQGPDTAQKIGEAVNVNDPGQLVKLYERVLPYAILFGREKEWAKRLGDFYETTQTSPGWYSGATAFNAAVFASTLNSFSTTASYAGGSDSSSSGGSGGGGSSGGGGGGGGGGGW